MSRGDLASAVAARLVAVAVAATLVVGALALRERRTGTAAGDDSAPLDGPVRLVCATELADVCAALAGEDLTVVAEDAGETAARLSDPDASAGEAPSAWLVAYPWPQLVADARRRAGLPELLTAGAPLASSPLAVAVWDERARVLAEACGGRLSWPCIGAQAPRRWQEVGGPAAWGPVKPVVPDPARTATGLLTLAQATVAYHDGRTDLSRADLAADAYRAWLADLARALVDPPAGPPLQAMLQFGPARFDLVATVEAHAQPLLAGSARGEEVEVVALDPPVAMEAVLATPTGGPVPVDVDAVRAALAQAGWEPVSGAATPGAGQGGGRGLPSPGVLEALRSVWREVS